MESRGEALLEVEQLSMRWPTTGKQVLSGVDLRVDAGEFVVMLGSNGSGKSTLLRCIVRLLTPSSGSIVVSGHNLANLSGAELRDARRDIAMVWQSPNLVKRRSVIANVVAGSLGRHTDMRTALGFLPPAELPRAHEYLSYVGLGALAKQRAGTLSGGQAQRVAVARALAQTPKVLLADEPVASLDPQSAEEICRLLQRLARENNIAVLCVLHQPDLALRYADRIVGLRSGVIEFDAPVAEVAAEQISAIYASEAAA